MSGSSGLHTTRKLAWTGFLFTLPFLVLFLIFTVLPVLESAWLSLTNYNMMESGQWVGFDNYFNLFTNDDVFLIALKTRCCSRCWWDRPVWCFPSFLPMSSAS